MFKMFSLSKQKVVSSTVKTTTDCEEEAQMATALRVYAHYLGVDLENELYLLPVAEKAFFNLPKDWEIGLGDGETTGIPFFYNSMTGESCWKHPYEEDNFKTIKAAKETHRKSTTFHLSNDADKNGSQKANDDVACRNNNPDSTLKPLIQNTMMVDAACKSPKLLDNTFGNSGKDLPSAQLHTINSTNPAKAKSVMVEQNIKEMKAALQIYAQDLGIDIKTEPHLLPVAKKAFYNLPKNWDIGVGEGECLGIPFFFNGEIGESFWKHPCDEQNMLNVKLAREEFAKKSKNACNHNNLVTIYSVLEEKRELEEVCQQLQLRNEELLEQFAELQRQMGRR